MTELLGPVDIERHASRIRTLFDKWCDDFARHDLDAMMSLIAPDAIEFVPDMAPLVGRDAIRAFHRDWLDLLPRSVLKFETHEIIVAASGDLAVHRGAYRLTPDTLRPASARSGTFLRVWRRREGEWCLQMNMRNSIAPG